MKLVSELTNNSLSMLFAEKVAGWTNLIWDGGDAKGSPPGETDFLFYPSFAISANAIVPWLEKWGDYYAFFGIDLENNPVTKITVSCAVTRGTHEGRAIGPNGFPRAACIALLAANGITEVEP
jgi:hypothetical protein